MNQALDQIVAMLKRFEGCCLTAYQDVVGVWTIGYGETLGVKQGDVWTQEQADNTLRQRAGQFMLATLLRCARLHTEPEDRTIACTSLAYNIGVGAFGASSVSRKTMRGDYTGAANAFLLWNKAAGRAVRGLTLRRKMERLRYMGSAA
ncbi:MAG: lysozyme [Gallionellaceae bacterium]|nr:lysozyme [Gallionellaceae bacterium]